MKELYHIQSRRTICILPRSAYPDRQGRVVFFASQKISILKPLTVCTTAAAAGRFCGGSVPAPSVSPKEQDKGRSIPGGREIVTVCHHRPVSDFIQQQKSFLLHHRVRLRKSNALNLQSYGKMEVPISKYLLLPHPLLLA